jgi:hypothetical protein
MSEQENDLIIGPGQFIEVNEEKFLELITAYEDILTCKHVESWDDMGGGCHGIPQESAIKIANRLLELDPNNVIANDTLDIKEGLLLIKYVKEEYEYKLIPKEERWKIPHTIEKSKVVPRRITTLKEALNFAGWEKNE